MKKNIFVLISAAMLFFGIIVGAIFPTFAVALGCPQEIAYSAAFILLCIVAGIAVGIVNILIARVIMEQSLSMLVKYMTDINNTIETNTLLQRDITTGLKECTICNTFGDKLGEIASLYDKLLNTLVSQFSKQNKIRSFTGLLNTNLDLDVMSKKALEELIESVNAKGGAIAIEQNGELEILASYHMIEPEKILESKIPWDTLRMSRKQYLSVPEQVKIDGLLTKFRPTHTMIEPIIHKGVALGLVILSNDQPFEDQNLELFDVLVGSIGMTIKNAVAHEQLARLAAKDPLTDLYNRRFGLSRLSEEYSRSIRNNVPLGIAMLDIDHFKKINDVYGHLVGDKVISHLAKTLQGAVREGDVPIRYGGEEFLLLLPGASQADSLKMAERVRYLAEEMVINHLDNQIKFTVSIGVASFPENEADKIEDIIKVADEALYRAKESGRNKVIAG